MSWHAPVIAILLAALSVAPPEYGFGQAPLQLLESGMNAFKARDFAGAVQAFSALAKTQPTAANFNYLAVAEVSAGNLDGAIADFQRSVELGNRSASVQYNLGLAFMQKDQRQAGIQAFRQAVSLDPSYYPAQFALATALMDSGRAEEAMPYLEKARTGMPGDARVWTAIVKAQFLAGDSRAAAQTAADAVEAIPDDPKLAVTLATLCIHHQEIQTARNLLEDAIELIPENVQVRLLLARASLLAGEPIETLSVLRNVPDSASCEENAERLLLIGESRALTGNQAAATTDITSAVQSAPGNARYLAALAWVYQLGGRYRESMEILARARAMDRTNPELPYRLAVGYYFLGQVPQAEKACRETLKLSPAYASAYFLRGVISLDQKRPELAARDLKKAVSLNSDVSLFHRELGVVLFQSGKAGEAKQELAQALKFNSKDAEAYRWMGEVLSAQGAQEEAIADLNTAIALQPGDSQSYTALAHLYTEAGNTALAQKTLAEQRKIQAASHSPSPHGILEAVPRLN